MTTLRYWQKQNICTFPDKWGHINMFWLYLTVIYAYISILWALHRKCCVNLYNKFFSLDKLISINYTPSITFITAPYFGAIAGPFYTGGQLLKVKLAAFYLLRQNYVPLHLSKSITWNQENFDFPACWSVRPSTRCHICARWASPRLLSWSIQPSQNGVNAAPDFLCQSTERAWLKEHTTLVQQGQPRDWCWDKLRISN